MNFSGRSPALFTIGFTGRTARSFFEAISEAGVITVIDIRRSNTSQLAGFSKKGDMPYFLEKLCGARYEHHPELSPEPELLKAFRAGELNWPRFADAFRAQMTHGGAPNLLAESDVRGGCLLCACHDHDECHRRLVAELLSKRFPDLETRHV